MPPTHHPYTYTLPGTSTRSLQTHRLPQATSRARARTHHFNVFGERLHRQHIILQAASTTTEERFHMPVPNMLLRQRQLHHGSIHDPPPGDFIRESVNSMVLGFESRWGNRDLPAGVLLDNMLKISWSTISAKFFVHLRARGEEGPCGAKLAFQARLGGWEGPIRGPSGGRSARAARPGHGLDVKPACSPICAVGMAGEPDMCA